MINIVQKGWGREEWIHNSPLYCGKILYINERKRLSFHYHKLKDETFYVQSGTLLLRYYTDTNIDALITDWKEVSCLDLEFEVLQANDTFHVPVGMRHTLLAYEDSKVFEFSTQHFDSDSIRILKGD